MKRPPCRTILLALTGVLALSTGCVGSFTAPKGMVRFKANPPVMASKRTLYRLAIAQFENMKQESDVLKSGAAATMVPFYFKKTGYVYLDDYFYEYSSNKPPEAASRRSGDYRYRCDIRLGEKKRFDACLADDLKASGLFQSVRSEKWEDLAEDRSDVDLVITGRLKYDRLKVSYFAPYGLSILGWLLTLYTPLPAASIQRELAVEFTVLSARVPSPPLWSTTVKLAPERKLVYNGIHTLMLLDYFANFRDTGYVEHNFDTPQLYRQACYQLREQLAPLLGPSGAIGKILRKNSGIE